MASVGLAILNLGMESQRLPDPPPALLLAVALTARPLTVKRVHREPRA